jgi:hypothetical protein
MSEKKRTDGKIPNYQEICESAAVDKQKIEHMTRKEMIAEIFAMLADADTEKLRRVIDEVIKYGN